MQFGVLNVISSTQLHYIFLTVLNISADVNITKKNSNNNREINRFMSFLSYGHYIRYDKNNLYNTTRMFAQYY